MSDDNRFHVTCLSAVDALRAAAWRNHASGSACPCLVHAGSVIQLRPGTNGALRLLRRVGPSYGQPSAPAVPADQVVEWRRSVYSRGIWARPVSLPGSAAAPPASGAHAAERRLQDWVARELQALLQVEVRA